MFRGTRPHRDGYRHPPPSRGFGPRPGPGHFRDRGPHSPPDPYRRSSPRRRYSPPHHSDEYRGARPLPKGYGRYSSSPPHPNDHGLVITVGNEMSRPSGYPGTEAPYIRDYGAGESHYHKPPYCPRRPSYDASRRRSVSPGMSRARSRSPGYGRSRSRPRSKSRSRPRSKSRSRSKSRGRSRGRSKSRQRGKSYSRSRSRSGSRGRSRAKSKGRSQSRGRSRGKSQNRGRSRERSCSGSSNSSSSSSSRSSRSQHRKNKEEEDFRELEKARRHKEIQDMLARPAKSILKKRMDSSETDSPMLMQKSDSPPHSTGGLSQAEEVLAALSKTMDPGLLSSMLGKGSDVNILEELMAKIQGSKEGGNDLFLPQQKSDLTELLGMFTEVAQPQNIKRRHPDIEDEEKFLYGDEENETGCINQSKETVKDSSHPNAEHDTSPYIFTRTIENAPSCSAATPELNAQEEPAEFPPGVGPEDVSARKEVEEYEKIQDLLKTVGLDLNVAEISKMAARTQARIHGNTPARKTLLQRQSDRKRQSRSRSYSSSSSSNSSNSSRSSSRSSSRNSSLEPSPTYSKKKAASSEKEAHTQSKKEAQAVISETTWPSAPTTTPEAYPPRPGFSAHPRSSLLGPPPQAVLPPPDFQAHSYPYGNYIPYMPSGWPMYPQTAMQVPPPNIPDPYMPPKMERPLLRTIKNDNKNATSKLDAMTSKMMSSSSHSKEMEDKNTASQKQKVTEELEKLRKENEMRHKRKQNLLKDVETLRRQQGELLRKKRREKDGHKDPFLLELSQLQEDAMTQISKLRAEQNEADEKHDELMKVALILGINPKDSKDYGAQSQSKELAKGFERSGDKTSSSYTKMSSKSRASPEKLQTPPQSSSQSLDTAVEQFEYYDAGNHWCKNCNVTSGSMFDYFMHLHSKSHRKTLDPYDRPWAKSECEKKLPAGKRTSKPAKGSEFLIPVRGFFCLLCQQFFGDPICAEAHVTCHDHNDQYQSKMYENPLYEQRRNLDRQVGMENQKSLELKRRYDNEDQVDVKKFKHSEVEKQHCIKEDNRNIKTFDRQYKQKYKEDSEKPKYKEDEEYSYRYKEGERSRYEEDGYRNRNEHFYRHKEVDDRNRYRQDKDRGRYSRDEGRNDKDEDKGFKNSRDLEEKAKHKGDNWGKWQKSKLDENQMKKEYNSQYQRGKTDILPDEKESAGKSLAEKPSEPPKVLCGPSPAMLAKLRKKNEDVTGRPAVGKFIRKKPQKSVLEKEAERMAAQFIKEEEEQKLVNDELDPFARSIAAAKSIAIKLTGQPVAPPSGAWVAYNEDKTNPSVPSPFSPVVIRKAFTTVQHKQNPPTASTANQKSPASSANLVSKACSGEEVQIKETKSTSPVDMVKTPVSKENTTTPLTPTQHPTLSTAPQTVQTTTVKTVMPAPVPAPPAKKEELKTPLVKQMEPAPNKAMKTQVKPGAPMEQVFTLQPDVAAPGVPVEEQKQTVVLRPPPQMFSNARGAASIIGKPKTLAAGRAKDLFSIFYSGNSAMNTAVGNGKDFGFAPVGGKIYKDTNNEDKNSGVTPRKPTANDDYCKENKESVTKVELPKSEDSTKDQSKEISQNDGSDSLVMVQSCMNKVTQVACNETDVVQIKVSSKTEGFEVNSGIIEGAEVAQNTQPLDEDVASEECTKSQDLQVTQTWDSPINKNLEDENSKASPKNKESKVAENDESLKSNELQNIPYGDSTITQDLEAENKEAMSYENFKVQSESSENADLQHAQSKNSPIHKCSETEASKDCLNNKESKTVQSNESPKRVSEDSPVNKFSEDSKETPKTVKLQDDDSEVAQSENALNEDDKDEILAAKESPKNEGVMVVLINDSPLNDDSEDQSTKNENLCVEPVFENTTIENENNESNEKVFEDLQVLKPIEIEMEEVGNVDTLIQTSTEEENPLDSEEPMTFSPLPGSFTEQLNLDTFDFSFEPL